MDPGYGALGIEISPYLGQGEPATNDVNMIVEEVEKGLPHERMRISEALENQAFYDLDGDRYAQRREAETSFDFVERPQRETGFTQEVVDILCEHQYSCGPARKAEDATADEFLQGVYEDVHIDAVLHEAEVLSTLNDVCAVEVKATNDPKKPIELRLWGGEEFTVFVSPDDPKKPIAVVTIDRVNQQTRYRVWFKDVVRTFITKPYSPDVTAGARIAQEVLPPEPNTYGCLPFCFVHYKDPVRRFWTPGVGTFLRKVEARLNDRLSELDASAQKDGAPIGFLRNVGPEFNFEISPGRFIRLYAPATMDGGDYTGGKEPDAFFLQAQLNMAEKWLDVTNFAQQALEAARVPLSAVRLEANGATSGIQIIAEQAPLLTRAKSRRPMFIRCETCLARVILVVAGHHYDRPELVTAAVELRLLMSWPEPNIPIPGPDRDNHDEWELRMGISSRIQLVMQRKGMTRDQAVAYLKQLKKDEDEADAIDPPPEPPEPNETEKTGLKTEKGAQP